MRTTRSLGADIQGVQRRGFGFGFVVEAVGLGFGESGLGFRV